jgi:hypothetical protein
VNSAGSVSVHPVTSPFARIPALAAGLAAPRARRRRGLRPALLALGTAWGGPVTLDAFEIDRAGAGRACTVVRVGASASQSAPSRAASTR